MIFLKTAKHFSENFSDFSHEDLDEYLSWYKDLVLTEADTLAKEVNSSLAHQDWRADLSPESLVPLESWFAERATYRSLSASELIDLKETAAFPEEIQGVELSDLTFETVFKVSIYFSAVMVAANQGLRWTVIKNDKANIYYGHPLLKGFGRLELSPVHVISIVAYKLADNPKPSGLMIGLFRYWDALAKK